MNIQVALFIPCYIDQFYPHIAIATYQLLQKLGVEVVYPSGQTCCGQPMANAGFERYAQNTSTHFVDLFHEYEYIVGPSASCVLHIREHLHQHPDKQKSEHVKTHIYEICDFLYNVLEVHEWDLAFDHKVGLHLSCHGLRGMRLAQSSERVLPYFSIMRSLLENVPGIDLVELSRRDECCGFGGTFAVSEEAVSVKMGKDRLQDHLQHEVEIVTGGDVSCLMHLEGISKRQKYPLKFMHISEILNESKR